MGKKAKYYSNMFSLINSKLLKNEKLRKIKNLYYYLDAILLFLFTKKPKKTENKKKKVIVIFNMFLGDGVIFITALKNLRKIYPNDEYEITLTCQNGLDSIYKKLGIFDNVIPLKYTAATIHLKDRIKTMKELRKTYYDIVIEPIGIDECSMNVLMTRVICADEKIGFINKDKPVHCPTRYIKRIYTNIIELNEGKKHYMEIYNDFFNKLGNLNSLAEFIDLPSEKVKESLPEKYFIVYPSASQDYKRWPVERFAEITKKMYHELKIPLVICGTESDRKTNNELIQLIGDDIPIIDMINKTTVLEYIDLIKKANFIITNDTGIYHIAAISQVPVAILAGGYTYDKFLIYKFNGDEKFKKPYVIIENLDCINCGNRCIYANEMGNTWPCLEKITVDKAWNTIKKMIDENK